MKLTVLSILIFMLLAGLAMVQMDANTDNHIQELSETEMLTTHGTATTEACERRTNVGDGEDGPRSNICNSKDCWLEWNGQGWSSFKQIGLGYVWCMGEYDANNDCYIFDIDQGTQDCAFRQEYWGPFCHGWFARPFIWVVLVEGVIDKPRDAPCTSSSS